MQVLRVPSNGFREYSLQEDGFLINVCFDRIFSLKLYLCNKTKGKVHRGNHLFQYKNTIRSGMLERQEKDKTVFNQSIKGFHRRKHPELTTVMAEEHVE